MKHTFQVAFTSHLGSKRKYCFSVPDEATHQKWGQALSKQVAATIESKRPDAMSPRAAIRQAAEIVSLQVLRDALIPREDVPTVQGAVGNSSGLGRTTRPQRSGSVSVAYAVAQGRTEMELGPLMSGRNSQSRVQVTGMSGAPGDGEQGVEGEGGGAAEKEDQTSGMVEVQSGKELVLLCRQNSLLPGVLELLQSGLPGAGGRAGAGRSEREGPIGQAGPVGRTNGPAGSAMSNLDRAMSKRGGGGRV